LNKSIVCIYSMQITLYRVYLKTDTINIRIDESQWYSVLKDIYGSPGQNFDGYISKVHSDTNESLTVHCYTIEGPEERDRLSELKTIHTNWPLHRKSCLTTAILSFASHLGLKIRSYETVELTPV